MVWLTELAFAAAFGVMALGFAWGAGFAVALVIAFILCDFLVLGVQRAVLMRILGPEAYVSFVGRHIVGSGLFDSVVSALVVTAFVAWLLRPVWWVAAVCAVFDVYMKNESNKMLHARSGEVVG